MKNADKPAYPLDNLSESELMQGYGKEYLGLTKRERFAMAAMQGILAGDVDKDTQFGAVASHAVDFADALLEELED